MEAQAPDLDYKDHGVIDSFCDGYLPVHMEMPPEGIDSTKAPPTPD